MCNVSNRSKRTHENGSNDRHGTDDVEGGHRNPSHFAASSAQLSTKGSDSPPHRTFASSLPSMRRRSHPQTGGDFGVIYFALLPDGAIKIGRTSAPHCRM